MPEADDKFTTNALIIILLGIVVLAFLGSFLRNLGGFYTDFLADFYAQRWVSVLLFFKLTIIGADVLLIGFMAYSGWRYYQLRYPRQPGEEKIVILPAEDIVNNEWREIIKLMNSENASERNIAVLRADALMENTLHQLGYEGASFADRLKLVSRSTLPSIDELWSAHRVRNIIAHDPVERHAPEMLRHALSAYACAFQELKLLSPSPETQSFVSSTDSPPPL